MRNHAHLTSSHQFPRKVDYLSVNIDQFPTSSQRFGQLQNDQFPLVPKIHAQFDQFPLVPKVGNWSKTPFAHDQFPLPPLYRGGVGTGGVDIRK
jgi:hypothetical protein